MYPLRTVVIGFFFLFCFIEKSINFLKTIYSVMELITKKTGTRINIYFGK